jgi:peptidoglycan/LPS O-acetylase OafA/YrhL
MNATGTIPTQMGAPADADGSRLGHLPQLDGFRGLSALLVLAGHALEFSTVRFAAFGERMAQLGVLLFFVLSGFLITRLLDRERVSSGEINLGYFYVRRALRLAPALLLFLAVCFVLAKSGAITDIPKYEFLVCLLYLRNIYGQSQSLGHLWSLALEEQFYLIWPWFMKFIRRDRLLAVAVTLTALISIFRMVSIRLAVSPSYQRGIFYERPWFRFDSILIGCCLALVLLEDRTYRKHLAAAASQVPKVLSWGLLIAWTAWGEKLSHAFYITFQMILAAFVLSQLVVVAKEKAFILFDSAWLRYCGKISYSLYLWQQLFLVVKYPQWGLLRTFPLILLITFACAMFSYHCIESPALKLKNRFERSPGPPTQVGSFPGTAAEA